MSTLVPDEIKPLRVSEVNIAVNELLAETMPALWVEGELTGWKSYPSGHIYFGLKEGDIGRIDAVMWRGNAIRLPAGVAFNAGMSVIAFGTVSIYPKTGQYRIEVQRLLPQGLGAAEEALRKLREKLGKKGYFSEERKRAIPPFPNRIAVVTSGHGAAIRDILEIVVRQWPAHDVIVMSVAVQGDRAPAEISASIRLLNRIHASGLAIDAIIVGRGGGSAEDLSAFNAEQVADAIFQSTIPIVSAVGHEVDFSIADAVADYRATTPTNAAEHVTQYWAGARELLQVSAESMTAALVAKITQTQRRLDDFASRRPFRAPLDAIRDRQSRLDELQQRFTDGMRRTLDRKTEGIKATTARLEALSPLNVLTRGYSLTQTAAGAVLRDAENVRVGDKIVTRLRRGRVESMITATTTEDAP